MTLSKQAQTIREALDFVIDEGDDGYCPRSFDVIMQAATSLVELIEEIEMTGRLTSALGHVRIFFSKPSRAPSDKQALNAAVAHGPQNLSVAIVNSEFYDVWRAQIYGHLQNVIRIKAQIHDSIFFQYRKNRPDAPQLVCDMMQTAVEVKGADGVTRTMRIPSDISCGKPRWSELK